jgi:hypothetical protein
MKRTAFALALALPLAVFAQEPPTISGCSTLSWTFPVEREAEVKHFIVRTSQLSTGLKGTIPADQRSISCAALQLVAGVNNVTVQAIGVVNGNNSPVLAATVEYVPPPLPAPTDPVYE